CTSYFAGAGCAVEQSPCRCAGQFARQCEAFLKIKVRAGRALRELGLVNLRESFEIGSDRVVHLMRLCYIQSSSFAFHRRTVFIAEYLPRRVSTLDRLLQISFA